MDKFIQCLLLFSLITIVSCTTTKNIENQAIYDELAELETLHQLLIDSELHSDLNSYYGKKYYEIGPSDSIGVNATLDTEENMLETIRKSKQELLDYINAKNDYSEPLFNPERHTILTSASEKEIESNFYNYYSFYPTTYFKNNLKFHANKHQKLKLVDGEYALTTDKLLDFSSPDDFLMALKEWCNTYKITSEDRSLKVFNNFHNGQYKAGVYIFLPIQKIDEQAKPTEDAWAYYDDPKKIKLTDRFRISLITLNMEEFNSGFIESHHDTSIDEIIYQISKGPDELNDNIKENYAPLKYVNFYVAELKYDRDLEKFSVFGEWNQNLNLMFEHLYYSNLYKLIYWKL